jgi:hypothetical protein
MRKKSVRANVVREMWRGCSRQFTRLERLVAAQKETKKHGERQQEGEAKDG